MLYAAGAALAKRERHAHYSYRYASVDDYENDETNENDESDMTAIGRWMVVASADNAEQPPAVVAATSVPAPAPSVPDIPKEWAAQIENVARASVSAEAEQARAEAAQATPASTSAAVVADAAPLAVVNSIPVTPTTPLDPPAAWGAQLRAVATHSSYDVSSTAADAGSVIGTSPTGPTAIPEPESLHRVDSADLRRRHSAHHHHPTDAPHHHHDLHHPLQEIKYHAHEVYERVHPGVERAEAAVVHGLKEAGHTIEVALENSAGVSGVWFPTVPDGFETEPAAAHAAAEKAKADAEKAKVAAEQAKAEARAAVKAAHDEGN